MAKVVKNRKGHKVIKISRNEMLDRLSRYGTLGICDSCSSPASEGYYVAVLNRWYCPDCYRRFTNTVDHYKSNEPIESRNFERYRKIFKVNEEA